MAGQLPALNFSGQDSSFKKMASAFLSKHNVSFQPIGDSQEEYQAVIKVRFGSNTTRASTAQDNVLFKNNAVKKDPPGIMDKLKAMNTNNKIYDMVDEMHRLIDIANTPSSNENQGKEGKNTIDKNIDILEKEKSQKVSPDKEKELQRNCEKLGQILKVKDLVGKGGAKKNLFESSRSGEIGKEKVLNSSDHFQQKKALDKTKLKKTEQKNNEIKIWGEYGETQILNSSSTRNNAKGKSDKTGFGLMPEQPKLLEIPHPSPNNVNSSSEPQIEKKEAEDKKNNEQNQKLSSNKDKSNQSPNNGQIETGSQSERKTYNKSVKNNIVQPKIPIKYLSGEKMNARPGLKDKKVKTTEKQIPASARVPETEFDYSFREEEKRIGFLPKRSLNFEHLSSGELIEYHQVLVDQARYSPTYALATRQKSGPYLLKDSFSKLINEKVKS